jgi:hypothetical protein
MLEIERSHRPPLGALATTTTRLLAPTARVLAA